MRHLLRHAAVRTAGETAVHVSVIEDLEWAGSLPCTKAGQVQDRQSNHCALHLSGIKRAREFVDRERATVFVSMHATMHPQHRPILCTANNDDWQFDWCTVRHRADL